MQWIVRVSGSDEKGFIIRNGVLEIGQYLTAPKGDKVRVDERPSFWFIRYEGQGRFRFVYAVFVIDPSQHCIVRIEIDVEGGRVATLTGGSDGDDIVLEDYIDKPTQLWYFQSW